MQVLRILSFNSLDENLIRLWKYMWRRSKYANFFNSYDFFLICLKTFKIKDYEIFCLIDNNELVMLLPLIKKRVFGIYSYVNPGGRFLEKSSLLIKDNDKKLLKKFIDFILTKGSVHLSEIPEDVAYNLKSAYSKSVVSIISINPYIDLLLDPLRQISKENLRKLSNKILKNKKRIKHFHLRKDLDKALELVFNLEKISHKRSMSKEIFNTKLSRQYYKNLISISGKNIIIDLLTFNDTPYVSLTGIICKGNYYAYHTCYLREFKYLMPGKMIIFYALKKLRKEGVVIFDFVRGLTDFKEEFTKDFLIQYDCYLSKNYLINFYWKLINFLRRFRIVFLKTENSKDYLYLFKNL